MFLDGYVTDPATGRSHPVHCGWLQATGNRRDICSATQDSVRAHAPARVCSRRRRTPPPSARPPAAAAASLPSAHERDRTRRAPRAARRAPRADPLPRCALPPAPAAPRSPLRQPAASRSSCGPPQPRRRPRRLRPAGSVIYQAGADGVSCSRGRLRPYTTPRAPSPSLRPLRRPSAAPAPAPPPTGVLRPPPRSVGRRPRGCLRHYAALQSGRSLPDA